MMDRYRTPGAEGYGTKSFIQDINTIIMLAVCNITTLANDVADHNPVANLMLVFNAQFLSYSDGSYQEV